MCHLLQDVVIVGVLKAGFLGHICVPDLWKEEEKKEKVERKWLPFNDVT